MIILIFFTSIYNSFWENPEYINYQRRTYGVYKHIADTGDISKATQSPKLP